MSLAPRLALYGIALSSLLGLLAATGPTASAVSIDWVTVTGTSTPNAADDTGYGSVAGTYLIGRYEVTNAEYAAFLNAVAATDANGLYNASMGSGYGGITQNGSSGSFTYNTIANRGNMPVNYVSFYDALRFANWLHNGQTTGAQDNTTTEDGAYTITLAGITANSITRNTGAQVFLTSEDEWYKAAYYDVIFSSYYDYPTFSDTAPTAEAPPGTDMTNGSANYNNVVGDLTDVGAYDSKPSNSFYGTFDQGGNLWEYNEAIISTTNRGIRGGGWNSTNAAHLGVAVRANKNPTGEDEFVGFRVAAVIPEPSTAILLAGGLAGLAAAGRRRSLH